MALFVVKSFVKLQCWHIQCRTLRPWLVQFLVPHPDLWMFPRNLVTWKGEVLVRKREATPNPEVSTLPQFHSHCLQPSPSLPQFHHHPLLALVACLTKVLFVWLLLCLYFCITRPSFILEFYCLTSQITNILCLLLFQANRLFLQRATIGFGTKSEEQIWSWQKIRDFIIYFFTVFTSIFIFRVNLSKFIITAKTKWVFPCVLSVYTLQP